MKLLFRIVYPVIHLFINLFYISFNKIGQNNQSGKSILKSDYSEENDVEKNLKLAVKILLKVKIYRKKLFVLDSFLLELF